MVCGWACDASAGLTLRCWCAAARRAFKPARPTGAADAAEARDDAAEAGEADDAAWSEGARDMEGAWLTAGMDVCTSSWAWWPTLAGGGGAVPGMSGRAEV